MRTVLSGLLAAVVGLAWGLVPTAAHAETTLCTGTSFNSTFACDPGWAVNMTFMHWRMYAGHNCTNYVAWRLSVDGVPEPSYLLGSAGSWASRAKSHGVPVNSTASAGAVGTWPGRGHVVYVDQMFPDGTLLITEDSWSLKRYRKYTVVPGERNYPKTFIHFKDNPATVGGVVTGPDPVVSGTAVVGGTLSAQAGSWGPAGVQLTYQWLRDGVIIRGATALSYTLTSADVGHAMTIAITGKAGGLLPRTARSQPTAKVAAGTITPGAPSIRGTVAKGTTLSAVPGQWAPAGIRLTYQWFADGAPVSGANKSTLKIKKKLLSKAIAVRVTGSGTGYTAVPAMSPAIRAGAAGATPSPTPAPVAAKPIPAVVPGVPTVSGSPSMMVGDTVTANPGTWGPAPVATTVQWMRNGAAIPGATGLSYVLTNADVGATLRIDVTGTKSGYSPGRASSASTAPVIQRALVAVVEPAVSGDPVVGATLTVSPGTWSPSGYSTSVQWTRNGQPIPGAVGPMYQPSSADRGQTIGVVVTATHPTVAGQSRTLTTSGPVRAASELVIGVTKAKPNHAKTLQVLVRAMGTGNPATVTITEGSQLIATVQARRRGVEHVFRSTPGVHVLTFSFAGDGGMTPAVATRPVKIP